MVPKEVRNAFEQILYFAQNFTYLSLPDYQKDIRFKTGGYQFRNFGEEFGWGKSFITDEAVEVLTDLYNKYTKGYKTITMLYHIKPIEN